MKIAKERVRIQKGRGNVFADLGFADPEEAQAKAQIARHINRLIAARGLTQSDAGKLLGVPSRAFPT